MNLRGRMLMALLIIMALNALTPLTRASLSLATAEFPQ